MTTATAVEFKEAVLSNGLTIQAEIVPGALTAASGFFFRTGARDEDPAVMGVSHFLEHMMFKGTENLAPNEFSRIIAANGGRENAFTGRDYTAYFQTMEADRLEVSFRLEAERMRKLIIDETELIKEREVVAEERRMRTEDNPIAMTREAFNATAFVNSPYHHPIVGWMSDINNYEAEDLREWHY